MVKKKITRKRKETNSTISSRKATAPKVLKYGLITGLTLAIAAVLAGGSLFAYYVSSAPKLSESKLSPTNSNLIYGSSDNLIADLGSEKRESVTADNIPLNLVNAITSIGDKCLFKHRGIDIYRILGAALNNLVSPSTQGGSTLD